MEKNIFKIIRWILVIFLMITTFLLFLFLLQTRLFPLRYILIGMVIATVTVSGLSIGIIHTKVYKAVMILCCILAVAISSINVWGSYALLRGVSSFDIINNTHEESLVQVMVLKDSKLASLNDIDKKEIAIVKNSSKVIEGFKKELEDKKIVVAYKNERTYYELLEDLLDHKTEVIVIEPSQIAEYKKTIPDFDEKVKVIYETKIKTSVVRDTAVSDIAKNPFIVYISGIDTYGEISETSRTDVNILMVVNPQKHEILLVNMPRDLFVPIPCVNDYDKLTHVGNLGIECSIKTIEEFYDSKINYFVRLNFTSLIDLIDAIGGVTVQNPYEFYTGSWLEEHNRLLFKEGTLDLNGHDSLVYARERYSLKEGDIDRGRNQRRIIDGMIKKLTTPTVLTSFNKILESVEKVIQTDLSKKQIQDLIRYQLDSGESWKLYSQEMKVEYGSSGGYYVPNQQLSVGFPIVESRLHVINQIENMLNGDPIDENLIEVGTIDYAGSR